jgi:hypothetical protein
MARISAPEHPQFHCRYCLLISFSHPGKIIWRFLMFMAQAHNGTRSANPLFFWQVKRAVPKTVPEINRLRGFQLEGVPRGPTEPAEIELFTD